MNFEDFVRAQSDSGFGDVFAGMFSGNCPAARKCETKQELALWFMQLGNAAGAALRPKGKR